MTPGDDAPSLSMLWESADPRTTLRDRFGLVDPASAGRLLAGLLLQRWGLRTRCARVVLSASNLLAELTNQTRTYVAKACVDRARFARLEQVADVVARLGDQGLPVAPPVRALDGSLRVVVDEAVPLSVVVLPRVDGTHLDATDPEAVHATGAALAAVHLALADSGPAPHGGAASDDHPRLPVPRVGRLRAPAAARRLDALTAGLPALDVPGQLVHGDVRGANVLVDHGRVTGLLDWDELRPGHRVLDLAAAAVKLATRFRTWDPPPPGSRAHLVAGYCGVARLTEAEELWLEAGVLVEGLGQAAVTAAHDPYGWVAAVERGL